MARIWRVYHHPLPGTPGIEVELSPEEGHHVQRVLRLTPGAALRLFDGRGVEWESRLLEVRPGRVRVTLERERTERVEASLQVVLFAGICRADRMEWMIQKSTEIGVARLHPVATSRSDAPPPGRKRLRRWRRIAIEAAKQSGRRIVPAIEPLDDLPAAERHPALLLHPGPESLPLGALLEGAAPPTVRLATGPESGFDGPELARWSERGWRQAALGPRTLRAETAGVVAASILLHAWGDLGRAVRPD
jgi:16S rRNA (uracil1498-N3)-methyltransferase